MGSTEAAGPAGGAAPGQRGLVEALGGILALAPPEVAQAVRAAIRGLHQTINQAQPDAAENGPAELEDWYQVAISSLLAALRANRAIGNTMGALPADVVEPGAPPAQVTDADIPADGGAGAAALRFSHETLPAHAIDVALGKVWDKLIRTYQVGEYARAYQDLEQSGELADRACQRWERLHLLSLRLSEADAMEWRQEASSAVAAVLADSGRAMVIDGPDVPVPRLPEIGYLGSGVLDDQELPADLADAAGRLRPESVPLARLAATTCWLYERDRLREKRSPWDPARYRQAIGDRMRNLADAQAVDDGGELEFTRVVELDQEIRSVYPVPFPQRDSWWSAHLRRLWAAVATHPHHERIQLPEHLVGQRFNALLTGQLVEGRDSVGVSPSKEPPGPGWSHGDVAWVLRLGYADRDGEDYPALVVYVRRT
jgi:hypothetical protein